MTKSETLNTTVYVTIREEDIKTAIEDWLKGRVRPEYGFNFDEWTIKLRLEDDRVSAYCSTEVINKEND